MDFSYFVGREYHPALRWLGRLPRPWLQCLPAEPLPPGKDGRVLQRTRYRVDEAWVRSQPGYAEHAAAVDFFLRGRRNGTDVCWFNAFSGCLANGPKIFEPGEEQFEAMEHVDVNVPIVDYRQPYPALVVRIPPGCRRRLAEENGLDYKTCPDLLVMHTFETSSGRAIFFGCPFSIAHPGVNDVTYFFQSGPVLTEVEDAIRTFVPWEGETPASMASANYAAAVARAAVNLMLLLVHYGSKPGPGLDPKAFAKHRSHPKYERFRHADFQTVLMQQHVVVRGRDGREADGDPTGREVVPHWRRGHWRNQPHGPGLSLTRLTFIRPVLVRADRAVGDVGESSAAYKV